LRVLPSGCDVNSRVETESPFEGATSSFSHLCVKAFESLLSLFGLAGVLLGEHLFEGVVIADLGVREGAEKCLEAGADTGVVGNVGSGHRGFPSGWRGVGRRQNSSVALGVVGSVTHVTDDPG
jgi:hypothetical protein